MNKHDFDAIAELLHNYVPFTEGGSDIESLVEDMCVLFSNNPSFDKEIFLSRIGNDVAMEKYFNLLNR